MNKRLYKTGWKSIPQLLSLDQRGELPDRKTLPFLESRLIIHTWIYQHWCPLNGWGPINQLAIRPAYLFVYCCCCWFAVHELGYCLRTNGRYNANLRLGCWCIFWWTAILLDVKILYASDMNSPTAQVWLTHKLLLNLSMPRCLNKSVTQSFNHPVSHLASQRVSQ